MGGLEVRCAYGVNIQDGALLTKIFRWLFLIEGAVTLLIGILSFFYMPASAAQTKSWFRPNGWFSDRELTIVVNRVLRDDPSKGGSPPPFLVLPC